MWIVRRILFSVLILSPTISAAEVSGSSAPISRSRLDYLQSRLEISLDAQTNKFQVVEEPPIKNWRYWADEAIFFVEDMADLVTDGISDISSYFSSAGYPSNSLVGTSLAQDIPSPYALESTMKSYSRSLNANTALRVEQRIRNKLGLTSSHANGAVAKFLPASLRHFDRSSMRNFRDVAKVH